MESSAAPTVPAAVENTGRKIELRRMLIFAGVISIVLLAVNAFVCATASYFFQVPGWLAWQAAPAALALAFMAATILGFRYSNPLLRGVYGISAAWLGALNFAFFAAVVCWLSSVVVGMTGLPVPRFAIAATVFGAALLATAYGLINAAWLRVTRITLRWPHLPDAWQGRTAVLVTDLHLGHLSGPRFLRRVIARLRTLQPDVVLISGDMFDGTTAELDRLVAPWKEFSTPWGIYYVTGNHDEFAERGIYLRAVAGTGVRALNNEKLLLHGVQLIGVHDSEACDPAQLRDILRRVHVNPKLPSILLAHRPVNLSVAEEEGISLQLSGHTHQGQIWPWNYLVVRIYGRFAYGLHRLGRLQVYTSCGLGTWGPPLRVATKPEMVLIRFERGSEEGAPQ